MFKPLGKEEISKIIDLELDKIKARLADRKIEINMDESAKNFIIENAYSPIYGARPIKRFLQKNIETALGKKIISGEVADKQEVSITSNGQGIEIK